MDLLLIEKKAKGTMFLWTILIDLCMVIDYSMEENIFVVTVCRFVIQKKYQRVILKIASKLIVKKD